jgi:hypothetical protein
MLMADDRVVIAGERQEFTEGVETDNSRALWIFDPSISSLRVLSTAPPSGSIAMSATGVLYVANTEGTTFNVRQVDPRTGETSAFRPAA